MNCLELCCGNNPSTPPYKHLSCMELRRVIRGSSDSEQIAAESKSNRELKREKAEQAAQLIAQLKRDCPRPENVEVWDVRARDPKLLVFLKSYHNSVPVPRHWSQKRKYLQGKRGIEKPPFQLPSYIEETGMHLLNQSRKVCMAFVRL